MDSDTIVAISSAAGRASRIIVRASGDRAGAICSELAGPNVFRGGSATQARLRFAGIVVPAWIYCFASPRSATGEDIVEFHIPGNPILARMLLETIVDLGARQANAGEFTARAYFNGRIDLAEAEGVAAAISAQSERELLVARQLMAGELAHRLRPVIDSIADTLALIEAGIDFTDQDISFLTIDQVKQRIALALTQLASLVQESARLERLSHEPQIVLTGRPNAGKSTLLNKLAGQERAMVSPIAGTTRDVLWADVELARGTVRLIDVAGLEDVATGNPIDQAMQQQARRAIEEADRVVLIQDSTDPAPPMNIGRVPDLHVRTKVDLTPESQAGRSRPGQIAVSAQTEQGLSELRSILNELCFGRLGTEATLALNARHVELIDEARDSLTRAQRLVPDGGLELLAMELREGLDALGGVLGSITPDDVLGRVFSRFCIGK